MNKTQKRMDGDSGTRPLPCPRCGGPVDCGMSAGRQTCWCFELPHVLAVPDGARAAERDGCLCERCLREQIEAAGKPSQERPIGPLGPDS